MENNLKKIFNANLFLRTLTAITLLPIVLFSIYTGGMPLYILLTLAAILMSYEWYKITRTSISWLLVGVPYILIPILSIFFIRENTLEITLWLFFTIWVADISAYFSGRAIGGKKLAPKISPNKTWAGLIGALVMSYFFGLLSKYYLGACNCLVFITIIVGGLSQAGDLFESWIKRKFNVKDSGNILPGHGGILDRVDGLTLTAPLIAVLVFLYRNYFCI